MILCNQLPEVAWWNNGSFNLVHVYRQKLAFEADISLANAALLIRHTLSIKCQWSFYRVSNSIPFVPKSRTIIFSPRWPLQAQNNWFNTCRSVYIKKSSVCCCKSVWRQVQLCMAITRRMYQPPPWASGKMEIGTENESLCDYQALVFVWLSILRLFPRDSLTQACWFDVLLPPHARFRTRLFAGASSVLDILPGEYHWRFYKILNSRPSVPKLVIISLCETEMDICKVWISTQHKPRFEPETWT